MEQVSKRSKRARVVVDYARLDGTGFSDCVRVQHKKLARAVLKFEEQPSVDNYCVDYVGANELAARAHSTGFRNPCVVRVSDVPASALGIRVPEGELTVERIADLVGRSRHINTIDVTTQSEGPVYTMQEWIEYFATPSPRKPLLNVVSLDLDNTSLQAMVSAPTLVKELDLVDKAWPPFVSPSPKVQLYTLMSVAGCFMDFHIDFGGFVCMVPCVEWAEDLSRHSTDSRQFDGVRGVGFFRQTGQRFLRRSGKWLPKVRSGARGYTFAVSPQDGLLNNLGICVFSPQIGVETGVVTEFVVFPFGITGARPGGWPHCVVTPMDSIVLGGNFWPDTICLFNWKYTWQMEERLRVRSKFRFPLYKELMWHTAATYLKLLKEDAGGDVCKVSKWERDGLRSLVIWLRFWLSQMKDGNDVPKEIYPPGNLLVEDLDKYTQKQEFTDLVQDSNDSSRTPIALKPAPTLQIDIRKASLPDYAVNLFEDNDDEFDPREEEGEDDEDEDYRVGGNARCQGRSKSKREEDRYVSTSPGQRQSFRHLLYRLIRRAFQGN